MSTSFPDWLMQQLSLRGWIPADLVRATGLNSSTVSRWLNPHAGPPSPSSCAKIARALKIDDDEVLRAAGHIGQMGEESPTYAFREIDPRAISIARLLASDPELVFLDRALSAGLFAVLHGEGGGAVAELVLDDVGLSAGGEHPTPSTRASARFAGPSDL